jgi:hypothetical protein
MEMKRGTSLAALALLASLPHLNGCVHSDAPGAGPGPTAKAAPARPQVPPGAHLTVRLTSSLSSQYARVGDPWAGVVLTPVGGRDGEAIPAGAEVRGTITGAVQARRGSRAMIDLAIAEIAVDGKPLPVHAATEPVIAGSPRARTVGAIAGGVGEGAGNVAAVREDLANGDTAISAVGYQVILKEGTVLEFVVSDEVAMR